MITVPLFQRNWPPAPSAAVKSQSYEIISSACAQDPSASCRHRPAFQLGLRERNLHRAALGAVGFDPSILLSSEPGQFSTQAAQGTVQASSPLDLWMCSVLPWPRVSRAPGFGAQTPKSESVLIACMCWASELFSQGPYLSGCRRCLD